MNETSSPISRRTLAKGAAWALPVLSVAAAAPALAASPAQCPAAPGWRETSKSDRAFSVNANNKNRSRVDLEFGTYAPDLTAIPGATGFLWTPLEVTATDTSGVSYPGTRLRNNSKIKNNEGELRVEVDFDGFSSDPEWTKRRHLVSYTVSHQLEYLRGSQPPLSCTYVSTITAVFRGGEYDQGELTSLG